MCTHHNFLKPRSCTRCPDWFNKNVIVAFKLMYDVCMLQKMYLVMEYCGGGELSKMLKARDTFSETDSRTIMNRLASAISYLHKNGKNSSYAVYS